MIIIPECICNTHFLVSAAFQYLKARGIPFPSQSFISISHRLWELAFKLVLYFSTS